MSNYINNKSNGFSLKKEQHRVSYNQAKVGQRDFGKAREYQGMSGNFFYYLGNYMFSRLNQGGF